jgi:hypothetical protein
MSTEERIALDALEQIGVTGVSLWHLRCLAAFRRSVRDLGWPKVGEYDNPRAWSECRYKHDLQASTLDELHGRAQWDDAEWTARRHGETHRPTRPEPEMFQESLT